MFEMMQLQPCSGMHRHDELQIVEEEDYVVLLAAILLEE